jgi:hypothetical protein
MLWLPTEREMFESYLIFYSASDETEDNQTQLEYYTSDESRIKVSTANNGYPTITVPSGTPHWEASFYKGPITGSMPTDVFCFVHAVGNASLTFSVDYNADVAPAFCVR